MPVFRGSPQRASAGTPCGMLCSFTPALNRDLFRGHMHLSAMLRERAAAGRPVRIGGRLSGLGQADAGRGLARTGLLPLGFANGVRLNCDVAEGQPLRWSDVAFDATAIKPSECAARWKQPSPDRTHDAAIARAHLPLLGGSGASRLTGGMGAPREPALRLTYTCHISRMLRAGAPRGARAAGPHQPLASGRR